MAGKKVVTLQCAPGVAVVVSYPEMVKQITTYFRNNAEDAWARAFAAVTAEEVLTPGNRLSLAGGYVAQAMADFIDRLPEHVFGAAQLALDAAALTSLSTIRARETAGDAGMIQSSPAGVLARPEHKAARDSLILAATHMAERDLHPKARRAGSGRKRGTVKAKRPTPNDARLELRARELRGKHKQSSRVHRALVREGVPGAKNEKQVQKKLARLAPRVSRLSDDDLRAIAGSSDA